MLRGYFMLIECRRQILLPVFNQQTDKEKPITKTIKLKSLKLWKKILTVRYLMLCRIQAADAACI